MARLPVVWSAAALDDLDRLHNFLYRHNPGAAGKAALAILHGTELLEDSPNIGRPMPDETGRRELFVAFGAGAYVLRYRLQSDKAVLIVRVWHSREDRHE